jgi:D-erythronate 2-dehydrogenase
MRQSGGLHVAVTGAAGFIGRAVVARLERGALGPIAELRLNDVQAIDHGDAVIVQGTYADAAVRVSLLADGIDVLFHLASLPGGAAAENPRLGRQVNLDGTIALIDAVAAEPTRSDPPVIVYTSSIAALGMGTATVAGDAPLRPTGSYGTHKAMVELYLADLTRQGSIDARSVRPAGIVARPQEKYAGFATAWMSDLFHAAVERRPLRIPARADTQFWLQSIDTVADNIVHAARMDASGLPPHRAWTLPATVVTAGALVAALERKTANPMQVDFAGGPMRQPPLDSSDALALGFVTDGQVDDLVANVLAGLDGKYSPQQELESAND